MAATGVQPRLSAWLLRPYLDLGPLQMGPLHARALEECWYVYANPHTSAVVPQRAMPPAFRVQLAEEAGEAYVVSDPRELPEQLRTSRWRALCAELDGWLDLSEERKCRIALLLHSMCLYRPIVALIPEPPIDPQRLGPSGVELAYRRAVANFMDKLPSRSSEYYEADLSIFEDIARKAADAVPTGFNATAVVFVHKAKTGAPLDQLVEWGNRLEDALLLAIKAADDFTTALLTSRLYRAMGFVPQRNAQKAEVVRTMELAERHALSMKPATPAQNMLYGENLHALMESRTKEALWLGDKDLALARTLKITEIDPFDPKAWVELGEVRYLRGEKRHAAEAYAVASMLGPPASAVGRSMAALCLRELGHDMLAALLFKDTLEIDPLGISPREEICTLRDSEVLRCLKEWSRSTTRS